MAEWLDRIVDRLPSRVRHFISRAPLAERLHDWIPVEDPRVTIRPLGGDWLCAYCGVRIMTPEWEGGPYGLLECPEVLEHLCQCPVVSVATDKPEMMPWSRIKDHVIRLRLDHWPQYRVTDGDGYWICPHCEQRTDVLLRTWDDSEVPDDWFLPAAIKHLEACAAYQSQPFRPKDAEGLRSHMGKGDLRKLLLQRIRTDPLFKICDDTGAWVDPFSERAIEEVNMFRLAWGPALHEVIVDYLLSPTCPGEKMGWKVPKTLDELHRLAGRLSAQRFDKGSRQTDADLDEVEIEPLDWTNVGKSAADKAAENDPHGHAALKKDLAAARQVQIKMLPDKAPVIPGYEMHTYYEPCTQLGGDMYYYVDIGDGRWGFLVADVSGHGVEAGMIMSLTMKSFKLRGPGQPNPAAVLSAVNYDVANDLPNGKFITAFYAVLDPQTGELHFSRAGHNPTFLVNPLKGSIQLLEGNGLPLGVATPELFARKLEVGTATLPPGGVLLMYTDGIVEAINAQKEQFGNRRVGQLLMQTARQSSDEIVDEIIGAVMNHANGQPMEDDLTLMALRRLDPEGNVE